ncbi:MAG: Ig-like domain-containing protein [Vulcanimicrobiaceae bacterium]
MNTRAIVAAIAGVAVCWRLAIAATPVDPCGAAGSDRRICIAGTLTAVDMLSEPPSLTVTYRGSVRTVAVNSAAKIVLEDVVARTQQRAKLEDLHVGDALAVTINRDGTVVSIEDRFGTRVGKIAAVSTSAIVLEGGRVLTPDRTTTIVLDGESANMADLHVGDTVTQRMNPQTGETHEIIAVRDATPAPASSSSSAAPKIESFSAEPLRPLRIGDKFTFALKGAPGGHATYDIGTFLLAQPLHEGPPGTYRATLAVTPGMNFAQMPVRAHLAVAGEIAALQADNKLSAATIAPQITDVAPTSDQIVNNNMPSIYATFAAPTDLGVDPKTVVLKVNGKDVSGSVTRTSSFVTYTCGTALPDGPVSVSVAVADFAGNETSRTWTFTIQTR